LSYFNCGDFETIFPFYSILAGKLMEIGMLTFTFSTGLFGENLSSCLIAEAFGDALGEAVGVPLD
jgi:hypothetical protein